LLILGIDTETTGLSKDKDTITELGMVLWSTKHRSPVKIYNELIKNDRQPELTPFITKLTGIQQPMIDKFGVCPKEALTTFVDMAMEASAVMAHNAPFDIRMIEAEFKHQKVPMPSFTWLDSQADIEYPEDCKHKNLTYLGAYHGFVNPFPHRAVTDVLSMLKIADKYAWEETIAMATSEKVTVRAICAKPWEDTKEVKDTDIAKSFGFKFHAGKKEWVKEIPDASFKEFNKKLQEAGIRAVRLKGQGS